MSHLVRSATIALAALVPVACADAEQEPAEQTEAHAPAVTVASADVMPDTAADAVWAHLQSEAYRDNWQLWPGKGELYTGGEPHGLLLTTYVNDLAHDALIENGVDGLPEGAIIVKENYMPDSTFAATTVMMKVDGYNPDHADWLFGKYGADGAVQAFGRPTGCQACHVQAGDSYVYTPLPQ